jgi:hypothetical protein
MCAVVRLRALMARQAARLITNPPIASKKAVHIPDALWQAENIVISAMIAQTLGTAGNWDVHVVSHSPRALMIQGECMSQGRAT